MSVLDRRRTEIFRAEGKNITDSKLFGKLLYPER